PARAQHTAILDDRSTPNRVVVFGGESPTPLSDLWQLSLTPPETWTPMSPIGTGPSARSGATAVFDFPNRRMIVFGGGVPQQSQNNDVWSLSLDDNPTWTELHPLGGPPAGRRDHTAIYDDTGARMILFGGSPSAGQALGDLWSLSLPQCL